jgi:hypothetical protein
VEILDSSGNSIDVALHELRQSLLTSHYGIVGTNPGNEQMHQLGCPR